MFLATSNGQILTFSFGLIVLVILQSDPTGSCSTPHDKPGKCIDVQKCDSVVKILGSSKPLSEEAVNFLKNSQCGFEGDIPKVCCEIVNETEKLTLNEVLIKVENHRNIHHINSLQCGQIDNLYSDVKIMGSGGNKSGIFEFPWMALIAYNNSNAIEFKCGGSIISKRYILTAAHCITSLPKPLILRGVRIGEHDLSTLKDCEYDGEHAICTSGPVDLEIEKTLYHPGFMVPKLQNDIALIRVNQDIDFRPLNIRPICLPVNQRVTPNNRSKLIATGWGETETGASSNYLVKVMLPWVSNEYCKEVYQNIAPIGFKQMCAGGIDRKDSCIGDSGGPLQSISIINGTLKFIQHGIVSFGVKTCGALGYPGVYTKVIYYLDWILDNLSD